MVSRAWDRRAGRAEFYQMNMIERRAVELAFPRSIFVTFNGSEFRGLFPQRLPIFYMYSLRRGIRVKPWFCLQMTQRAVSALYDLTPAFERILGCLGLDRSRC